MPNETKNENVHLPNASVVKQKRVGGLPLVEMLHILECKLNSSYKNVVNHNKAKAEVRNTNNQTRPVLILFVNRQVMVNRLKIKTKIFTETSGPDLLECEVDWYIDQQDSRTTKLKI